MQLRRAIIMNVIPHMVRWFSLEALFCLIKIYVLFFDWSGIR